MLFAISFISYVLSFLLLVTLAKNDLKNYILPNLLNAALALSFCAFHISTHWQFISPLDAIYGALVGGGLLLLIRLAANQYYKDDALGLGDVKLMAAAGLGLGFPNILLVLSLGATFGALHGVLIGLQEKRKGHAIPFDKINVPAGVGLCLGIAIIALYQFRFWWQSYG